MGRHAKNRTGETTEVKCPRCERTRTVEGIVKPPRLFCDSCKKQIEIINMKEPCRCHIGSSDDLGEL